LIQFLVGGLNIAEPQPALRSIEVALIWEWEGLHLDRGILRQITPIEKPASEKEKGRTLLRPSRTTLKKYNFVPLPETLMNFEGEPGLNGTRNTLRTWPK
jgi:hypothetical protein